jgi:hypothetical protein
MGSIAEIARKVPGSAKIVGAVAVAWAILLWGVHPFFSLLGRLDWMGTRPRSARCGSSPVRPAVFDRHDPLGS